MTQTIQKTNPNGPAEICAPQAPPPLAMRQPPALSASFRSGAIHQITFAARAALAVSGEAKILAEPADHPPLRDAGDGSPRLPSSPSRGVYPKTAASASIHRPAAAGALGKKPNASGGEA